PGARGRSLKYRAEGVELEANQVSNRKCCSKGMRGSARKVAAEASAPALTALCRWSPSTVTNTSANTAAGRATYLPRSRKRNRPLAVPHTPRHIEAPMYSSSSSSGDSLDANSQRMPATSRTAPRAAGSRPEPTPATFPTALALTFSTDARPSRHSRPAASSSRLLILTLRRMAFPRNCLHGRRAGRLEGHQNITATLPFANVGARAALAFLALLDGRFAGRLAAPRCQQHSPRKNDDRRTGNLCRQLDGRFGRTEALHKEDVGDEHATGDPAQQPGAEGDNGRETVNQLQHQRAAPDEDGHAQAKAEYHVGELMVGMRVLCCTSNGDDVVQTHGEVSDDDGADRRHHRRAPLDVDMLVFLGSQQLDADHVKQQGADSPTYTHYRQHWRSEY